jgi:hypothetical protein
MAPRRDPYKNASTHYVQQPKTTTTPSTQSGTSERNATDSPHQPPAEHRLLGIIIEKAAWKNGELETTRRNLQKLRVSSRETRENKRGTTSQHAK